MDPRMIDEELKHRLDDAIADNSDLFELHKILREFKLHGGKQQDALDTLKSMSVDAPEDYYDRVLEIMDFASGWCQPRYKIW